METAIALDVAVAVVDFVEFSVTILNEPPGSRRRGKPLKFEDSNKINDQVLAHIEALKSALLYVKDDQSLGEIILDCINIAQQLAHGLQTLAFSGPDSQASERVPSYKSNSVHSKWTSLRQGLRTRWAAGHDTTLDSRLASIPEELATSLLAALASAVEVQSTLNGSLPIHEVLAFGNQDASTFIITVKGGQTHTVIMKPREGLEPGQYDTRLAKRAIHFTNVTARRTGPRIQLRPLDQERLTTSVLDGLSFRHIRDRFEDIQEAYKSTFNWIFEQAPQQGWADFPRWLEGEVDSGGSQRVYWVNGKAGSGKSTLLEFIWEDTRTWLCLNKWAAAESLVSASFFFWALGTRQQKTHQGLLRSLIHDVLEQRPSLIPAVMPEVVTQMVTSPQDIIPNGPNHPIHTPSLSQLKVWFKRLVNQASETCRLFFQIDGIDEFEGDWTDLISLINNTCSSSKHVKFLISSRPIPLCVETFASSPSLQLHCLTRADMISYCDFTIGKHLSRRHLSHLDRARFTQELVDKSSGVFLWVILVVKSIQNAVQSQADDPPSLRAILDEMPTDLTELYTHIVKRTIPVEFRFEASRILQIFQQSQQIERDIRGLPGLLGVQLFLALESDAPDSNTTHPLTRQQEKKMAKHVKSLLLTRCSGLLELQTRRESSGPGRRKRVKSLAEHVLSVGSNPARPHVGYIHRTVADFMQDKKVWSEIKSWSNVGENYSSGNNGTYRSLFKSCVAMVQRLPTSEVVHPRGSLVWETAYTGLRYAQLAEQKGRSIPVEDMEALDGALSRHWNKAQVWLQDGKYESVQGRHWSSIFFQFSDGETPDGGPTWTHNVKSNRDNGFRALATCSATDYEMIHSTTQHLGFLRLAVVYGLGSYIQAKPAFRDTIVSQITDTLDFWRNLLMSSFPLRLKVPAGWSLAASLLKTGILLGQSDSEQRLLDSQDAIVLWTIFLMELCSARDVGKMTTDQTHNVAHLVSEFVKLPCVCESMATGSGRFGNLLVQLRPVLKAKQLTDNTGLFEMMTAVVFTMEANYSAVVDVQNKDTVAKFRGNVCMRPVGAGSNLKRRYSSGTPSTTSGSSASEGSSGKGNGIGGRSPGSIGSFVKVGLGSFRELANTWSVSVEVARKVRERDVFSGKGVLRMVKTGTRKLKLPMAKRRAIWRELEVTGRGHRSGL